MGCFLQRLYGKLQLIRGDGRFRAVLTGRKGNLPAIFDSEPQRAGGVTYRAKAKRRTAEPLAQLGAEITSGI